MYIDTCIHTTGRLAAAHSDHVLDVHGAGDHLRRLLREQPGEDLRVTQPQGGRRRRHLHGRRRLRPRALHLRNGRLRVQIRHRLRHHRRLRRLQRPLRHRRLRFHVPEPQGHVVASRARLCELLHWHHRARQVRHGLGGVRVRGGPSAAPLRRICHHHVLQRELGEVRGREAGGE